MPSGPTMRPATPTGSEPRPSAATPVVTFPAMTHTSQIPPTILNRNILNHMRDTMKQYVLNMDTMPARPDLLSLLTLAASEVIKNQSKCIPMFTPSCQLITGTLVTTQDWIQTNEGNIRKLSDTASYIQSMFKDYAAHCVQDAFNLWEATAAENGLSVAEWKCKEVSHLLQDFVFLSMDTQVTVYWIYFQATADCQLLFSTLWAWTQGVRWSQAK